MPPGVNPFANSDINVPTNWHERLFERYCQGRANAKIINSPFPRMIDLWFFAVCIAVRNNKTPIEMGGPTTKIIDGGILGNDSGRVQALMLIAADSADDLDITTKPNEMMRIVSGLAVAGFPLVEEMLSSGGDEPLFSLSNAVMNMLDKPSP